MVGGVENGTNRNVAPHLNSTSILQAYTYLATRQTDIGLAIEIGRLCHSELISTTVGLQKVALMIFAKAFSLSLMLSSMSAAAVTK